MAILGKVVGCDAQTPPSFSTHRKQSAREKGNKAWQAKSATVTKKATHFIDIVNVYISPIELGAHNARTTGGGEIDWCQWKGNVGIPNKAPGAFDG